MLSIFLLMCSKLFFQSYILLFFFLFSPSVVSIMNIYSVDFDILYFFSSRLSFSIHNFHHVVFICHYSSCMSTSLYIFSLPNSLSYFSFIPLVSQTQNRVSRSLCTTCALSVTPSESQRPSDHIAWWFAPSMKTRLRSWSAMAEPCCGSSEPTPAKLPILGTHTHTRMQKAK